MERARIELRGMERKMEKMFASEGVTKSDRMLHTPGTFAKKNLLYVQEVGTLQSLAPHVCRRENLDSFLIFEVLEGSGSITTESRTIELHAGECVWIDCHNAFEHISSEEQPWKLAWVHFNGVSAKELYELFRERNELPVFTPLEAFKLSGMILAILEKLRMNASELEVHSLLTQLVVSCAEQKNEKERMEEVREYINLHFIEHELQTLLTEHFHMGVEELDRSFAKSYGISVRDYILNRRFNAAKELLRFTIKPIAEVIEESGIGNEDLFYQLFKENESMNPEDYRRKWAQWIKD